MLKRLIILGLSVAALLVVVALIDEELDPALQALVSPPVSTPDERNLFLAIRGVAYGADEAPHHAGLRRIEAQQQASPDMPMQYVPGDAIVMVHKIDLPKPFCRAGSAEATCLGALRQANISHPEWARDNTALIERYRLLRNYPEFDSTGFFSWVLVVPQLNEIHPIFLLQVAGKPVEAMTELMADMAFVRRGLRQADQVIDKMVFARMLERDVVLVRNLIAEGASLTADQKTLVPALTAPLTQDELSLSRVWQAMARDNVASIQALKQMLTAGKDPYAGLREMEGLPIPPFAATGWQRQISALLLKPNATANAATRELRDSIERLEGMSSTASWPVLSPSNVGLVTKLNALSNFSGKKWFLYQYSQQWRQTERELQQRLIDLDRLLRYHIATRDVYGAVALMS